MQRTEQDWGNLRDMGVEQGHRIEGQAEPRLRGHAPVRVHPGTEAEPGTPAPRAGDRHPASSSRSAKPGYVETGPEATAGRSDG